MDKRGDEPQRQHPARVDYKAIAFGTLTDENGRVADEQRSALPGITTVIMNNLPPFGSSVHKKALSKSFDDNSPAGQLQLQMHRKLTSTLRFSIELNQKLAYRETDLDQNHIAYSRPSGEPPRDEPENADVDLSQTAKAVAYRYAHNHEFSPLLADVVRTMQAAPRRSTTDAKKVEDQWMIVAKEINQLTEEAGANKEDIDSFLQTNPELQDEMDELIKVLDFADPVQRAIIVNTMKALTYLMFFAVIIGSWHLVAAYASLISIMGMSAQSVVKAVGAGTEKLLNKISPLSEKDTED